MNLPLEVDVSHRDSFVHNVTVDRAGMLLEVSAAGEGRRAILFLRNEQ